ncbi:RHS repeat-associated core domain-containing protein [Streptomyces sp. NPDC060002]|uniref:RHS repeat-associated core domain-containing protein n=1 Tax=Streptomyces sp. NPDC060002 TaxID=3347033 RepID=UPI0036CCFBEA
MALTPKTVAQGSTTWNLTYTADGQRFKKAAGNTVTTYIGDLYEKRQTSSGTTHVFHVAGPPGSIAQVTYSGTSAATTEYTLTDPQGSTATVTNSSGTSPQRQYFDPFGKRTDANGLPVNNGPTGITQGYTGHEMDDDFGLINMKGRLYDPKTKRFLAPDPHITNPNNPQNWNPYSYVNNNPVNATDPTGYDISANGGGVDGISTSYTVPMAPTYNADHGFADITGSTTVTLYGDAAISTGALYEQAAATVDADEMQPMEEVYGEIRQGGLEIDLSRRREEMPVYGLLEGEEYPDTPLWNEARSNARIGKLGVYAFELLTSGPVTAAAAVAAVEAGPYVRQGTPQSTSDVTYNGNGTLSSKHWGKPAYDGAALAGEIEKAGGSRIFYNGAGIEYNGGPGTAAVRTTDAGIIAFDGTTNANANAFVGHCWTRHGLLG